MGLIVGGAYFRNFTVSGGRYFLVYLGYSVKTTNV